jgi:hypothetical protein
VAKKHKTFLDKHGNLQTLLIGLTIVMFWRGAWGLMDLYLFPNNQTKSFMSSLIVGLILLFVLNHRKLRDLG